MNQGQPQAMNDVMISRVPIQQLDRAVLALAAELKLAGYSDQEIIDSVEQLVVQAGWTMNQYNNEFVSPNNAIHTEKKTLQLN